MKRFTKSARNRQKRNRRRFPISFRITMRVCGSNRRNRQTPADFVFTAQQSQKTKSANRPPTGESKSADFLQPEGTRDSHSRANIAATMSTR